MKKMLNNKFLIVSALAFTMSLAACGGDENVSKDKEEEPGDQVEKDDGLYSLDDFSPTKESEGEPIEGGTLKTAIVSDTPFEGTLNTNFYSGRPDAEVLDWFYGSLFEVDEAFNYTDEGAASLQVSEDKKIYTITIKDGVNWHDGEPVKAEDLAFAHEVIGDPDYDGVRYDASFQNIEGMKEYHAGEAEEISGINVVDDKTLEITYIEPSASLLSSGIWTAPLAKHIFEDIPVKDMAKSDAVRKNPVGFGPFKVEKITPGESVTYVKNEDYWQGEPLVDRVELKVIDPSTIAEALRTGEVDMLPAGQFPSAQFVDNADLSNIDWLGTPAGAYGYIGFKLGTWDKEKGEVVPDPGAKMADVNLRKAMAHALNQKEIGESLYHGMRFEATTLIPPYFSYYHDNDNEGLAYDPDLANQLLDEAGYEYDGDFRTTPDGGELTITFASMSGDDTSEAIAQQYIQWWKDVGLNVKLLDGRLHEFNSFYDRMKNDDPDIDMYNAGWGTGTDVDPEGLWGKDAMFNYTRYTDEDMQALFKRGLSLEAFDMDYRRGVYNEWQKYMQEIVPAFPTLDRIDVAPVNKRLSGYSISPSNVKYGLHTIQLNAKEPAVAE